ncbi:uncharacterized protein, YkwD family [Gracilibacillus orientalis]|uniref:Uncharacterized protein, YkwD family n=1 Tax=Gracilibacillus orientalis TaxID=334253 RepID=A0A1I4LRH7_9BACI|nr:CAP domain-containing protein [Gracilibacillus orientalis]SFL93456.1 uncharacterized protein, YkwD family [Gracilibacillus orientalis]
MIKKLLMTLLLIGAFVMTTGFSANTTVSTQYHVQSNSLTETENFSESTIQELIDKCIGDKSIEIEKQAEQKETEQPEKEQTPDESQPEEKQTNEEPEKSEQESNNNESEENAEQVEVPEQEEAKPEEPSKEDNAQENTEEQTEETNQSSEISQFEEQVVALTNQERQKQGLSALEIDTELSKVAKQKSEDMAANGYFSHNSPTYGSPFDMIQQSGIDYRTAGENIAKGQKSPEEVVNAWMNSEGHRANILNEDFTHIGVGYVEEGNHWTQQFIGK